MDGVLDLGECRDHHGRCCRMASVPKFEFCGRRSAFATPIRSCQQRRNVHMTPRNNNSKAFVMRKLSYCCCLLHGAILLSSILCLYMHRQMYSYRYPASEIWMTRHTSHVISYRLVLRLYMLQCHSRCGQRFGIWSQQRTT